MNDVKAWSTRRLVEAGLAARGAPIWARHGSTRNLNTPRSLSRAIAYVLQEQGVDWVDGRPSAP